MQKEYKLGDIAKNLSGDNLQFFQSYFEIDTRELFNFFNLNLCESIVADNNKTLTTHITLPKRTQGVFNNAHGGTVALILDAQMAMFGFIKFLYQGSILVTKDFKKIELFKPVPIEKNVTITSKIVREVDDKKFWIQSEITHNEQLLVRGEAFFLKVPIQKTES